MLQRPSASNIEHFLINQQGSGFSYSEVGATSDSIPDNYTIDRNSIELGKGPDAFRKAKTLLRNWQMFNLGWVQLLPVSTPIEVGATVAVMVNHFGFWSLNAARIIYVFDTERTYGFAYGTLQEHAEQGEEQFSIDWSTDDDSVSYRILAFSRPKKWQARIAYPLSRRLQIRFASDSMNTMKRSAQQKADYAQP